MQREKERKEKAKTQHGGGVIGGFESQTSSKTRTLAGDLALPGVVTESMDVEEWEGLVGDIGSVGF